MSGNRRWTRRGVVAAALGLALGTAKAAEPAPRVAALDWGWASTLVALGVPPAGVAECRSYAAWVGEPALPPGTAELGLRTTPSLETLAALQPSLILTNGLNALLRPQLERIAPTLDSPVFGPNRTPLANARTAARRLGDRLGQPGAAEAWIARSDARFAAARARLAPMAGRPVVPMQFVDARHVTYYGRGSLYGDVLGELGLVSAYPGETSQWGHHGGDVASLAALPPADLLIVAPLPPQSVALLDGPSLVASLLRIGGRRAYRLPSAWTFGELAAATRFAGLVADALAPTRA